ncbi:hypothetical protein BGW80DRAFT_180170 [Lactifluus volemus]|nr:hypothetical protein BGW80DRAFT_180170 [Lactifluus volemus]
MEWPLLSRRPFGCLCDVTERSHRGSALLHPNVDSLYIHRVRVKIARFGSYINSRNVFRYLSGVRTHWVLPRFLLSSMRSRVPVRSRCDRSGGIRMLRISYSPFSACSQHRNEHFSSAMRHDTFDSSWSLLGCVTQSKSTISHSPKIADIDINNKIHA